MKRVLLSLIILIFASTFCQAQNYSTGLGLRFGEPLGVTFKQSLGDASAFEGIFAWSTRGDGHLNISLLYELHASAFGLRDLYWFYGGGGNILLRGGGSTDVGIDGILGLEWAIPGIPFALAIDIKPTLWVIPSPDLSFGAAFSVRYTW